jgi:Acyltransferase family
MLIVAADPHDRSVNSSAETTTAGTKATNANVIALFARSASLIIVVLWHWLFAVVRWDDSGAHTGNPLHLIPGSFLLTWALQIMPVFFLVGGWASSGSFDRAAAKGTAPTTWVTARIKRLIVPVLPLVALVIAVRVFGSPWLFGMTLLAASPLWFLAVYVPLTAATPVMRRAHRRAPRLTLAVMLTMVGGLHYLRFVQGMTGLAITLISFLVVWGTVYQLGSYFETVLNQPSIALGCTIVGVLGIVGSHIGGGYSLSMVTTAADTRSNMGPPTVQVVWLALLQLGLLGLFGNMITRAMTHRRMRNAIIWTSERQMSIYALHFPIWVAVLLALRTTPLAMSSSASTTWLLTRPLWFVIPGSVLLAVLAMSEGKQKHHRSRRPQVRSVA